MTNIIKLIAVTISCLVFALIPEILMYFIYGIIDPSSTIEKILVFGLFWFGGFGLCILFAFIAFSLWAFLLN